MTRAQMIESINALVSEYFGYSTELGGIKGQSKTELLATLNRWASKVHHNNQYNAIMMQLGLTDNQRIAYSMGYTDALTPEQAIEYDRAMEHYKIATT